MTRKFLMAVSILAIIAAYPAFAQDGNSNAQAENQAETSAGAKLENTLEKTGEALGEAADKASAKTREAYRDMKAYFSDETDMAVVGSLKIENTVTSDHLVGLPIRNPDGEKAADIKDVIVSSDGGVRHVVAGQVGKDILLDGSMISNLRPDAEYAQATDSALSNAGAYDEDAIDAGLFSIRKLEGAKILDSDGKALATAKEILFEGGRARYIVAGFNQILNMGGDSAALDFAALDIVNTDGKYSFRLNAEQSAQFKTRKQEKDAR